MVRARRTGCKRQRRGRGKGARGCPQQPLEGPGGGISAGHDRSRGSEVPRSLSAPSAQPRGWLKALGAEEQPLFFGERLFVLQSWSQKAAAPPRTGQSPSPVPRLPAGIAPALLPASAGKKKKRLHRKAEPARRSQFPSSSRSVGFGGGIIWWLGAQRCSKSNHLRFIHSLPGTRKKSCL